MPACKERLDADCFRLHPQWAKQLLAYRLLHILIPPELSKKLPVFLRTFTPPPGVPVPPGYDPTLALYQPPIMPPSILESGATPPIYTAPWSPGPVNQPGKAGAPPIVYWFEEPFDNFTDNSWTDISSMGGTASIVAGHLRLLGTASAHRPGIRRDPGGTWPTNWTLEFSLNFKSGTDELRIELHTGVYRVRIFFTPPDTVDILPISGSCQATVPNYLDTVNTWKLEVTDNLATLYLNDSPVITNCNLFQFAFFIGRMEWLGLGVVESYVDFMTITED